MTYHFACSALYCYTVFALAMDNTTLCQDPLSIMNAFDLFDVMNLNNMYNERIFVFGAEGDRINYTLYVRLPNDLYDKRMIIFEGMRTLHTHRVCTHSLKQAALPLACMIIAYLLASLLIVIIIVWSINKCLKTTSSSSTSTTPAQRPWERFLSILRRFNMVAQNVSS